MKDFNYINIVLDIYRCSVLVLVAPDKESIIKGYRTVFKKFKCTGSLEQDIDEIKEVLKDDYAYKGTTFCFSGSPIDACVLVYADNLMEVTYEVIVHELYHAMKRVCSSHGIEDEEAEAYMLEYLCNQFWNAQDDWKAKHPEYKKNKKKQ